VGSFGRGSVFPEAEFFRALDTLHILVFYYVRLLSSLSSSFISILHDRRSSNHPIINQKQSKSTDEVAAVDFKISSKGKLPTAKKHSKCRPGFVSDSILRHLKAMKMFKDNQVAEQMVNQTVTTNLKEDWVASQTAISLVAVKNSQLANPEEGVRSQEEDLLYALRGKYNKLVGIRIDPVESLQGTTEVRLIKMIIASYKADDDIGVNKEADGSYRLFGQRGLFEIRDNSIHCTLCDECLPNKRDKLGKKASQICQYCRINILEINNADGRGR
jgi:hypothetical protein